MEAIRAVAPSTVAVDEPFSIGVKVLANPFYAGKGCYVRKPSMVSRYNENARGIRFMDNVAAEFRGTLEIEGGEGYEGPRTLRLVGGTDRHADDRRPVCRVEGLVFSTAGTKYLTIVDRQSGAKGVSNPIKVTDVAPRERLYWGDIHCQTFFSDGLRCPEELYSFARDEAFLDIFALSDHSESLTDRQWEYFTAVTNDFNAPRRFVTFVGLEWTSREWGHRNVYYPGDHGPCLRANDPVDGHLSRLYETARTHRALVIPHHSANAEMGVNWALGHDPEVERLVEIYSIWGNSERPSESGNTRPIAAHGGEVRGQHVVDALTLGRRYGFVAGGDVHDGRPGDELHQLQEQVPHYRMLHRQGIMGVWATGLTREAVFEALWNRRVFATTNVRVFLRFTVAGEPMGSEVRAGGDLPVVVEVASENPIERIDLVCEGQEVRRLTPHSREATWEVQAPAVDRDTWYYVRVTREDGEMAWSSPVWVLPGA